MVSSLARYAFNIYGDTRPRERPRRLEYPCERELTCLSQLQRPGQPPVVILGGKNCLRMLALNADNTAVVADSSIVDLARTPQKLFSVNTLKCTSDLVACGLANGAVHVYQVTLGGKNRLAYKLQDHKRVVNSLDFVDDSVLVSGSQDGTVKVWDLRTFSPRPVMQLAASHHSDPVRSCQASAHCRVRGKTIVLSVHDSGALCKLRRGGSAFCCAAPDCQHLRPGDESAVVHGGRAGPGRAHA